MRGSMFGEALAKPKVSFFNRCACVPTIKPVAGGSNASLGPRLVELTVTTHVYNTLVVSSGQFLLELMAQARQGTR